MKFLHFAIVLTLLTTNALAQSADNFIDFHIGYNLHDVNMKLNNGKKNPGCGFMSYVGYGYYFSQHWGVTAGLKYYTAKTTAELSFCDTLSKVSDLSLLLDDKEKNVSVTYSSLKEKNSETVVSIPIALCYRYIISPKLLFDTRVNIAPGIVVKQKFSTDRCGMNLSYSYHNTFNGADVIIDGLSLPETDDNKHVGFSGNPNLKDIILNTEVVIALVYSLSPRLSLLANVYGTYTITDQKTDNFAHLYNDETYFGVARTRFCSKIHPYLIGLSAGVRIFMGKK